MPCGVAYAIFDFQCVKQVWFNLAHPIMIKKLLVSPLARRILIPGSTRKVMPRALW